MNPSIRPQQLSTIVALLLFAVGCASNPRETGGSEEGGPASHMGTEHAAAEGSGIEGQVVLSPSCPVVRADRPCAPVPYRTTMQVRDPSGRIVAEFSSDAEGWFRVELDPGKYVIVPAAPESEMEPAAQPLEVVVEAGRYSRVKVKYESKIR